MKSIILVALAVAAVAVAVPVDTEPVKIIRSEYNQQPEGSYVFGYETENGIVRNENGELKEALDEDNKPHSVIAVRGSYSYTNPDGKVETVNYVADELGFKADGDSIPKLARK